MPVKQRLSVATQDILVEREIAVWDSHHYSTTGRPTAKDPVSVCLMTPRAIDQMFYGRGPTLEDAVVNALASNPGLNWNADGLTGACARLENELHALNSTFFKLSCDMGYIDDDIPF